MREVLGVVPDKWQENVLEAFPHNQRLAMKACKGPGKTGVLSWISWNFLLTRPHPKVVATSITSDNLSDGLWTEMAKWQNRSPLLRQMFRWNKTRIESLEHPETWWMSARTWPKSADTNKQADTLAGVHEDYVLFVLDEVGGIPDAVMVAAEAGLANAGAGGKEAHIVIAGNPTHLSGPLYRACTSESDLWHVTEINSDPADPNRTPRVSVEWAEQQIRKYGRDNPWVLVNVFGKFPPSSINTLLGPDEVRAAMKRSAQERDFASSARILGVDVAREGDDSSVIIMRQGIYAWQPQILRNVMSIQGAGAVARTWKDQDVDACFIDSTGGFGSGWIDQLRLLGRQPIGIHFSGKPLDDRYANKRAEMWFLMAQWIKDGGVLPEVPELVAELTEPTYTFLRDRLLLEDKDSVKERLGRSPDIADALGLTFALPVAGRSVREVLDRLHGGAKSHDEFGYGG